MSSKQWYIYTRYLKDITILNMLSFVYIYEYVPDIYTSISRQRDGGTTQFGRGNHTPSLAIILHLLIAFSSRLRHSTCNLELQPKRKPVPNVHDTFNNRPRYIFNLISDIYSTTEAQETACLIPLKPNMSIKEVFFDI